LSDFKASQQAHLEDDSTVGADRAASKRHFFNFREELE
jgi:hypothetical protein